MGVPKPGVMAATTDVPNAGVVVAAAAPKTGVAAAVDPKMPFVAGAPNVWPPPPPPPPLPPPNIELPVELLA